MRPMRTIIKNGRIVTAVDDYNADLLIEDGQVAMIAKSISAEADRIVDDGTIFKAMQVAGDNGGLICMHAENGVVIDVIVKQALAAGKTAPKYHALTRPTKAEAEGVHRAIALADIAGTSVYIVHLSN